MLEKVDSLWFSCHVLIRQSLMAWITNYGRKQGNKVKPRRNVHICPKQVLDSRVALNKLVTIMGCLVSVLMFNDFFYLFDVFCSEVFLSFSK